MKNMFENAKFGEMFLTTMNKKAVFLRLAENAENKFAVLYVEDWGTVQVYRNNGREVHGETDYDIVKKYSDLEEPKFKVGDKVISSKNPALTYKILEVGIVNELGNLDYRVDIFDNGTLVPKGHYACIECQKMDKWGELISSHTIKGWVARDENGTLAYYLEKPHLIESNHGDYFAYGKERHSLDLVDMPEITFENSPREVELIIREAK